VNKIHKIYNKKFENLRNVIFQDLKVTVQIYKNANLLMTNSH